ncbi:hypothetical protein [Paenibacillus dauci]|uniref:hypothetical protein n=1 Tax=Paenibacillus dauci TaxID=1567106 RepID=UPI000619E546|nr:hypothetical protein [Paenibacillus dauci]
MGYNVYITRAANWYENEGTPISLQEWKDYVESDPEFEMMEEIAVSLPNGSMMSYASEGMAMWVSEEEEVLFDYQEGNIVVKGPEDDVIEKMKHIASRLQAKVQGEENEEY